MKAVTHILFLTLVLLLSGCGGGSGGSTTSSETSSVTQYYVDATGGSDGNDGLSRTTAWKTLNKIANTNFTTTAEIYLKRGETWYEPLLINNDNITIDVYGVGTLPVVDGSTAVTNWVNNGLGIYSADITVGSGQGLGNLSENGIMLKFIPWDDNVTTTFSGSTTGSYSFDYLLNKLYIKPATSPNLNSYLASIELRGIYAKDRSNISVRNIEVTRISLNGIEFHDCINCDVDGVTVTRVGGAVIAANFIASPDFLHAGNGIDYSNSCSNGEVNNVTVSEIFDSCLAVELYLNNNNASNISLSNATLNQCGFTGVEVSVQSNQGVNTNSHIDGVSISSVTVDGAGKGWSGRRYGTEGHGMRIVADNGAGTMKNISVNSAEISDSAGDGIKVAGEINTVNFQRIRSTKNDGVGINVAEPTATSLLFELSSSIIDQNTGYGYSYNAPFAAGFKLYQNTFYNNGVINLAVFNQTGQVDIRNNLFYSSAAMTHLYSAATLVNPTLDNNCYNDATNMFGYNGSVYSTVVSLNVSTGFESLGVGHLSVAMNNPGTGDFTLSDSSSCRGLGATDIGVATDFINASYAIPPASGAYAYMP